MVLVQASRTQDDGVGLLDGLDDRGRRDRAFGLDPDPPNRDPGLAHGGLAARDRPVGVVKDEREALLAAGCTLPIGTRRPRRADAAPRARPRTGGCPRAVRPRARGEAGRSTRRRQRRDHAADAVATRLPQSAPQESQPYATAERHNAWDLCHGLLPLLARVWPASSGLPVHCPQHLATGLADRVTGKQGPQVATATRRNRWEREGGA